MRYFVNDIKFVINVSVYIALYFPICWLIPTLSELFQHLIELWMGMYDSEQAFLSLQRDPKRLGFGVIKVVTVVFISLIVVPRCLIHGSFSSSSRILDRHAIIKALGLVITSLISLGIGWALAQIIGYFQPSFLDLVPLKVLVIFTPFILLNFIHEKHFPRDFGILYSLECPPDSSRTLSRKLFVNQLIYAFVTTLPLMAIHFQLNAMSINAAPNVKCVLLVLDSFVIGGVAITMGATLIISFLNTTSRINELSLKY